MRVARLKSLVGRTLCAPPFSSVVSAWMGDSIRVGRCTITATTSVTSAKTRASLFWGMYESAELRLVSKYLRSDLDVVELGSSIGVVSAHIAQRLGSNRRMVCVEASPSLLPTLEANVKANAPDAMVTFLNRAIAYVAPGESVAFSVSRNNVASHVGRGDREVHVAATQLSELLRSAEIREYALVCDIEGAEAGIIHHDSRALGTCKQIIIELHQTEIAGSIVSVEDLAALFVAEGFETKASYGPVHVFSR